MMPLVLALALAAAPAGQRIALRGTVRDGSGLPVQHALVYIDGTQASTETDTGGRFDLAVDSVHAGTLTVFHEGFAAVSMPFDPSAVEPFTIVLTPAGVAEAVTVTAPRSPAPPTSTYSMRPLDVVRTAGAAADLMRALQTLPGVAQADEGAGLYVRGGDTSEVLVLLDDAVVFHPYRQETPGGGLFGSVEPFLLSGLSFSTGGFSAKYGNALSAVLDLHGLPRPESAQLTLTGGLAGASLLAAMPIGDHGGLRVSGNRSFPGLLFAVNGRPYDFNPLPGGWDVNASAHYDSLSAGSFKLFANATADQVGVTIDSLAFEGLLRSNTSSELVSLHWQKVLDGRWLTSAAVGTNRYVRGQDVGVLDLATTDFRTSWRATTATTTGRWTIRLGGDGVDTRTRVDGAVPVHGGDLGGIGGADPVHTRDDDNTVGAFAEAERQWGRVTTITGVRTERFDRANESDVDPRVNVSITTVPGQRASIAWGMFHQSPDAGYFGFAAPGGLDTMRARHVVLGYEVGTEADAIHMRAEGYWKTYDGLPVDNGAGLFDSSGYGQAHGLDLFAHLKRKRFEFTADYSWLDAERRWTALADRGTYTSLPAGTWRPAFDIPHTAHALARFDLTRALSAGAGWRISSGRLDTPVVGAISTPAGIVPQYGAIDSERLPRYERLDLTLTYLTQFFGGRSAILFAAVGNATARENFFSYAYNATYTERRPVTSNAPRVVYFGATIMR